MSIAAFWRYWPRGQWKPQNEVGSLSLTEYLVLLLTFQILYQGQDQLENWIWNDLWNLLITAKLNDK